MEFFDCLFGRRSIRNFTNESVSEDTIHDIINAAIHAPSACNFAAWKFIVITKGTPNREVLRNPLALRAPCGILVVYRNDLYVTGRVLKDYIQSASAAIQNMLLYITSIGLGAVWICGLPKASKLKKAFNIPKNFDVIGYVALGHPKVGNESSKAAMIYHYGDEETFRAHKRRYSVDQVMCKDSFTIVDGDCTHTKYPNRMKLLKHRCREYASQLKRKYTSTSK